MNEQCSTTTPHAAHDWNGRPMKFCPGVLELSPLNQCVGIVVNSEDGRLLIVHSVKRSEWCIPGGKPEGRESLKAAARRELYEETSLQCRYDDLKFSHEVERDVKGVRWYGTIFKVLYSRCVGSPQLQAVSKEIDGIMWVTPEEFEAYSPYTIVDLGEIFS